MVIYTAPQPYFSVVASLDEKVSLDYFLTESRGQFPLELPRSVLRAVHEEPVLVHAVHAFGALQRVYEFGEPGRGVVGIAETNGRLQFATREYGKAFGPL